MTGLIVVEKWGSGSAWKALVLDSVSSPITRRMYNMALDEFMAWFQQELRPGFTKGTVSAWRVSLEARGLSSSSISVRLSAIRKLAVEAADNGLLAPALAARDRTSEGRKEDRSAGRKLAVTAAGSGSSECTRYRHREGVPGSRHPGRSPRLRSPALRSGGPDICAHPTARWPLVHRGSGWETWSCTHDAHAEVVKVAIDVWTV